MDTLKHINCPCCLLEGGLEHRIRCRHCGIQLPASVSLDPQTLVSKVQDHFDLIILILLVALVMSPFIIAALIHR